MIDLIPIDFWSSTENKLLDICVKSGRFLKCAYDKFFEHTRHNYKSDEECRQNILTRQLFGICSDKISVLIANRLLW